MELVFTSCIFPRAYTNAKISSPDLRVDQLINSVISNLSKLKQSNTLPVKCYILEMVPSDSSLLKIYDEKFKPRILQTVSKYFLNIEIIDYEISSEQNQLLLKKGKGYGELLLLEHYITKYSKSLQILKISGRYEIENISYLNHLFSKSNKSLGVCYSKLLRNAVTHTYFSNPNILSDFIQYSKPILMDSISTSILNNGMTLEKCFYLFVKGRKDFVRLSYPKPSERTISGTTGNRYFGSKNIFREIVYNIL
jgi:hypothetical protein